MAQLPTRGTTPAAPTGVLTVADLLSRCAPAPVADPEPVTVPVSVGSLLRREGRAPHALDRPLRPHASQARAGSDAAEDESEDGPRRGIGMRVRRGAIAAGVLVAAGSVFGAAVVDDASSGAGADAQAQGSYPGQGRLDSTPLRDEAAPTVVDPAGLAASSEVLDAGEAPAGSWMTGVVADPAGGAAGTAGSGPGDDVARGGGSGGGDTAGTGGTGGGTPTGTGGTPDDGNGRSGNDGPGGGTPGGGGSSSSGGGSGSSGGSGGGGSGADAPATSPSGGLGGAVQGVGGAVPGPLGGTVEGVGGGVGGLGDGAQSATGGDSEDPGLVGSVGSLAGSLL